MLAPFLVVGLGGSGGKTLQTMRDDLQRLLVQKGWTGPLPVAWQLLQIDTPSTPGEREPDLPAPMTGDSYLGLTTVDVGFDAIDRSLDMRLQHNALARQATAGWRPRADRIGVPVHKGAGQYRAIGRILTVTYIQRIKESIDRAISRMQGMSADSELRSAAEVLGQDSSGPIPAPNVLVISSIAGGTGAGMLLDVCDVIRLTGGKSWTSDSYGFLYTPEVFDELPPAMRQGVRPNAFAALSEVLAGFWDKDGFGDDEAALLQMAGIPAGNTSRLGPRYPFLIGQSNGSVRLTSQNDVYRAAGRAISAWMTSQELQSSMSNYVSGNWASSSIQLDRVPFKIQSGGEEQESPFQAIGFGRVSLGRDRFLQYSAEFLSRRTVERLLRGHMEQRQNDRRSPEAILKEVADAEWETFLTRSNLDLGREVVDESGRVSKLMDAVRSDDIARNEVGALTDQVMQGLRRDTAGQQTAGQFVIGSVETQLAGAGRAAQDRYRLAGETQVAAWAVEAQRHLLKVSLETASSQGLPVTIDLLQRLSAHTGKIRRAVSSIAESRRRVVVNTQLDPGVMVTADDQQVRQFVHGHSRQRIAVADAELLEAFARSMDDLRVHFIEALVRELKGALEQMRTEAEGSQGQMSPFETWPSDHNVPRRLLPTQNERLLLDPTEYHDKLLDLATIQLTAASRGEALDRAIRKIVLAAMGGEVDPIVQYWVPTDSRFRQVNDLGERPGRNSRLRLDLSLRPSAVLARANGWLTEKETPLGDYVAEGIGDYFDERRVDDRVEIERRARLFGRELGEAIKASAPLVAVNAAVLSQVHPDASVTPHRIFNEFPFPLDSAAGKVADSVLQTATGLPKDDRAKLFGAAHPHPYVDIFSVLSSPMEAPVFDSLMRPLAAEWERASAGGPEALTRFWRLRRTRPLPQFIPMAPPVREAMIRGWFTANLLGQIKDDGRSAPLKIFVPGPHGLKGSFAEFPYPLLLPEGYSNADRIAGILKTAMAALIAVNTTASTEPLAAYRRLLELGRSRGGQLDSYDQANAALGNWVQLAEVDNGAPPPDPKIAGGKTDEPEQRQAVMLSRLQLWLETAERQIFEPVEQLADLNDVPRAWELRRDYRGALKDIAIALHNIVLFDDGGLV